MKYLMVIAALLILPPTGLYLIASTAIGADPAGERLARIQASKQYSAERQALQNTRQIPLHVGRSWTEILRDYYSNSAEKRPLQKLPEQVPEAAILAGKNMDIRFIWFGHSTILLELEGKRILIDPVFSDYASPLPIVAERFQPPVLTVEQIPDVDIVLLSHDHYDHLDLDTINQLKDRVQHFIAPIGVGAHLEYWGVPAQRITELDWWQDTRLLGLQFTCTPSQHFSGRGIFNRNSTLWASWAVRGEQTNVFFSGDSGYADHYRQIGERLGPFDVTFLENGAYNKDWQFVHQLPEEGVQAHLDLKGRIMVPVHWGMFDLALHSWYDPIQRVTQEARRKGVQLATPQLGQVVTISQGYPQQDWWSALIGRREADSQDTDSGS